MAPSCGHTLHCNKLLADAKFVKKCIPDKKRYRFWTRSSILFKDRYEILMEF